MDVCIRWLAEYGIVCGLRVAHPSDALWPPDMNLLINVTSYNFRRITAYTEILHVLQPLRFGCLCRLAA